MKKSDFSTAEISAIRRSLDFMDYEMEDQRLTPDGWTHIRYTFAFRSAFQKLRMPGDPQLDNDDLALIDFCLRMYLETEETHNITRGIPELSEEASAARRKIASQLSV